MEFSGEVGAWAGSYAKGLIAEYGEMIGEERVRFRRELVAAMVTWPEGESREGVRRAWEGICEMERESCK